MDFDLDFFFDISNKWSLTDDFHDISDLTSIFLDSSNSICLSSTFGCGGIDLLT